jgi:hypothetical protein
MRLLEEPVARPPRARSRRQNPNDRSAAPSNKRMQLTKLRAAPVWRAEVPPCAPAGRMVGGTASQLIPGVRRTSGGRGIR